MNPVASGHPLERRARSVGHVALQSLARRQAGTVLGVTSRGAFVRASDGRVLFISLESHRGPLTVNVEGVRAFEPATASGAGRAAGRPSASVDGQRRVPEGGRPAGGIEPDSIVQITPGRLSFPAARISIVCDPSAAWRPSPPASPPQPPAARRAALDRLAEEAAARSSGRGAAHCLPWLLRENPIVSPPTKRGNPCPSVSRCPLESVMALRDSLRAGQVAEAVRLAEAFLGLGPGLTPSGDDVLVGLLLALNRWSGELWRTPGLAEFNRSLVEAALRRTTALSANLIECAAHGESDERLLDAIDSLMTGTPPPADCLPGLLGWGQTSGADVLTGMAVALTIQDVPGPRDLTGLRSAT